jgi:hypothetical protein
MEWKRVKTLENSELSDYYFLDCQSEDYSQVAGFDAELMTI